MRPMALTVTVIPTLLSDLPFCKVLTANHADFEFVLIGMCGKLLHVPGNSLQPCWIQTELLQLQKDYHSHFSNVS